MKITLYYKGGKHNTFEGTIEELQKHMDKFNEDDDCCLWNFGEPTHEWTKNGWKPR